MNGCGGLWRVVEGMDPDFSLALPYFLPIIYPSTPSILSIPSTLKEEEK